MTRRPGSEYGAICPDCRHLRSDHRGHNDQYACLRKACPCVKPQAGPWLPLWTKADCDAFMAREGLRPLDEAGEIDGLWAVALVVVMAVALVLVAIACNHGQVQW